MYTLSSLPSPNPLQELDIQVQYSWWYTGAKTYQNTDMSVWDPLASRLSDQTQKGNFPHLKRVNIGIGTSPVDPDVVKPKDLFPMIRERFRSFSESGTTVSIEFYDLVA